MGDRVRQQVSWATSIGMACALAILATARAPLSMANPQQHAEPQHGGHQHPPAPQGLLGKPPLEFRPEALDFGTVRPNQRLSGIVYLQNLGSNWLKIAYAKPDCSCTTIHLASDVIAPGQSVALEADYHSNTIMGDKQGMVRVQIQGYDEIELPVKAFVTMPVRATPPYISALKDASGKPTLTGEYEVLSNDGKPFRVLAVNGEAPQFVDFNPAADQPRNTYRLKWDFTGFDPKSCRNAQGKRLPGWVIVETDRSDCPVFDLEVRHDCNLRSRTLRRTDTWVIQEKRVLLGGIKAGQPTEFEIVIKRFPKVISDELPKMAVSESRDFSVELVKIVPTEEGAVCTLRLTPAQQFTGLIDDTLRVHSERQSSILTVIAAVQ